MAYKHEILQMKTQNHAAATLFCSTTGTEQHVSARVSQQRHTTRVAKLPQNFTVTK